MTAPQPPAVPDELVERAWEAQWEALGSRSGIRLPKPTMAAALAAIADDLRAEARRECAAELRAFADAVLRWLHDDTASPTILGSIVAAARATADSWEVPMTAPAVQAIAEEAQ